MWVLICVAIRDNTPALSIQLAHVWLEHAAKGTSGWEAVHETDVFAQGAVCSFALLPRRVKC